MRCDRSITTLPTLTHWAAFSAKRGGATIQMPSFGPIGTPLLWKHRLRAQRPANGPSELDSERGTAHTALPHQRLAAVLWTYPIHWVCRRPNLDRFVILKSRDNLTALSCVRRLRVELLEIVKKDLDLVEVLDGPDGLECRLHDRRDILTEAEAQPGATSETITAALLDELREIRSSGPSASPPSTGDNAPTPLDDSRLVAILTGSDNATFRKITMVLSGLDLSTPSGQRDALALAYDGQCPITAFCRPSVTELTQSGIATIDESGEMHMDAAASNAGSTTPLSSADVPPAPDPSTLPYCNCHRRCFNRIWPQDRSPLCDFCYDGCDDCECAGEALGPQGQPCCVRPLEAATVCGECTGEVTPVTRTLGQMAVATPAGFAPRCSAPGCEAVSQLLADHLGHLRCPLAQAPSLPASPPASETDDSENVEDTEEVEVEFEFGEENLVLEFIESSPFPEPIADAPGAPPPAVVPPEPVPLEAPLFEEHLIFHEPLDMPANVGPRLADALAPSLRGKLESAVITLMVAGVGGDVPDLFDIKSASVRRARASLRKHSVSVDEWEAPKIKAAAWLAQYVAPPHETTSVRYMADNPLRRHAFGLLRHHMLVLADARDVLDSFGNYEMFIAGISDVAEIFEDIVVGARVVYDDNGADGDDADHSGVMLEPFVPAALAVLVPLRPSEDAVAGPALDPTPTEPTAKPTPPPSLPASPPASETGDDEEIEDIEEVEVELEVEEENLVLEVVVDAWAPCPPTSPPAPGLSTMASNTAVASPSTGSPRSAGGTLGVRACASLDWAGSGPAPRGLEVIYLAAGTTRLITARDPELNGGDWGGTYNVRVSPPEAETGWGSNYEVRITSERRHPRDQDSPTLLISWLSAWGRPLSSKLPAITTIEASARNTFGVETQRLSHGEIIAFGTPNGYWSGSTLLTPHLATTRLYWAFRLNVRSEPPLVPGPPGWPRRPPQSTPGNSEPGRRRQSSHLLFDASSCTAEQVEWARRFIASPSPAGETTAGGDE